MRSKYSLFTTNLKEFYKPHYDGWKMPENPEERSEEERIIKARYMDGQGGQRLVTCLVYLNRSEKEVQLSSHY